LGKPAFLHATTTFLTNNLHVGQHPHTSTLVPTLKTSIMVPRPVHLTGNSTVVLLTGKAALVPTLFFAHYKQDSASRKFKLLLTSF